MQMRHTDITLVDGVTRSALPDPRKLQIYKDFDRLRLVIWQDPAPIHGTTWHTPKEVPGRLWDPQTPHNTHRHIVSTKNVVGGKGRKSGKSSVS